MDETGVDTTGNETTGNETTASSSDAAAVAPGRWRAGEEERVLRRLERIEELDRKRAPARQLLGELRALVHEAEAWARVEADGRERNAVGKLRQEGEGMR